MKIVEIEALGEKRLMCCNLRTMKAITQKFGGSAEMREKLSGANVDDTLDTAIWLISAMMDGGYRYAQKNGVPCAPPPTEDELLDSVRNGLFRLPDDTRVVPGHGPFTSIGYEKKNNPYV